MSLENIFNKTLEEFKNRISKFKQKNPLLINQLGFNDKDPHIERMITAFALISASTKYEMEKKTNQAVNSVLLNILDDEFSLIPPMGIIKAQSIKHNCLIFDKSIVRAGKSIYKTYGDFYLNNLKLNIIEYVQYNTQNYLSLELIGDFKNVNRIDFHCSAELLNSIFDTRDQITAIVNNRKEYNTECSCEFNQSIKFQRYLFYPEAVLFFHINDIDFSAIKKKLIIQIPVQEVLDTPYIDINCLLVENSFFTQSDPLISDNKDNYPIITSDNTSIISVKKVEGMRGIIPHISIDPCGWYLFHKNDQFFIHFREEENNNHPNVINAKILVFNIQNEINDLYFEEYYPCNLQFINGPTNPTKLDNKDYMQRTINYFNQRTIEDKIKALNHYLSIRQELNHVELEIIDIMDSVKAIKFGKYTIPQAGKLISLSINVYNPLLLKFITKEIKQKSEVFIDFSIETPKGMIIL